MPKLKAAKPESEIITMPDGKEGKDERLSRSSYTRSEIAQNQQRHHCQSSS